MLSTLPRIAIGTEKITGRSCINYIQRGLALGYRQIDTAQVYQNETEVGTGIRSSGVPRSQVFITTKIATGFKKNPESVKEAIDSTRGSLERLGLEYIDLVLIHHPGDDKADPSAARNRQMTWQGLEELVSERRVKSIGLSNFTPSHIREMQQYAKVSPSVNQLELHPWCQQRQTVDFCKKENIALQAYCAIVRNTHAENDELGKMGETYKVSTVQLLLRWSLQKGYTPIVKTRTQVNLQNNWKANDFVISEGDMEVLDSWDRGLEGSLLPWLIEPDRT